MSNPVRSSWELHTSADQATAWAAFSDTDRFNHVAGLGFRFETEPQPDGGLRRTGRMRTMGMKLEWDELPFEYREPDWLRMRRVFRGGPGAEFTATIRLKAHPGGGTDIRYTVEVLPRNMLARPLVSADMVTRTRPQLDKALTALISSLDQTGQGFSPRPPELSAATSTKLDELLQGLPHPELAGRLGNLIRNAPLRDQDALRPKRLARQWGAPPRDVTELLLAATRAGVTSVHWALMCPSCFATKAPQPSGDVHCGSCGVTFDRSFPDSVAVHFRPAAGIRDFQVEVECLGSPAHQRHVLAQLTLEPGEEQEIGAPVPVGGYRIRTFPLRAACNIDVRNNALVTSPQVSVTDTAIDPPLLRATPGALTVQVRNTSPEPTTVALETRFRPPGLTSVGELLESFPAAAELLPADLRAERVESWTGAAIAMDVGLGHDAVALSAALAEAPLLSTGLSTVIAAWPSAEDAVATLARLNLDTHAFGLAFGTVTQAQGSPAPDGPAVRAALAAVDAASFGSVAIALEDLDTSLLTQAGWTGKDFEVDRPDGGQVRWFTRS